MTKFSKACFSIFFFKYSNNNIPELVYLKWKKFGSKAVKNCSLYSLFVRSSAKTHKH